MGLSMDTGRLSVIEGYNRAGTGSASVTVHGGGLGLMALTALGRLGQTGCEGTEWESETSVRCIVGHGSRGSRRVAMTAGGRMSSVSQGWSVDRGVLSVSRPVNRGGSGSASMTVHGSSIGMAQLSSTLRSGHTGCETSEWESETALRCRLGHGFTGTRRLSLTGVMSGASVTEAWSVDSPTLRSLLTEQSIGW